MSNQPYIGLRPFERDETDIFFGREQHSDELINRLGFSHFLAVIGTSGCGKSSLVKTGLIAGLEAGFLAKAGTHWRIVEMRPSQQPFQVLAEKLLAELADVLTPDYNVKRLEQALRQGSLSLHELLAKYPLPNNAQLLIVCDQFEEIFRYFQQGESAQARNFVSLLLASSKPYPLSPLSVSHSLYVVITMRSDFLGECAQFAGLAEAINQGLYLTPRLDAQQLREAIEEPAFGLGGKVEPALVTQLLEDAGNNQDQLPLLQHLLMRLWNLATDKAVALSLANYAAVGGLANALSRHADEVFDSLSNEQQRIAELMFRALTERADMQRDTRRPIQLAEIVALTGATFVEVVAVIDAFRDVGRCFLMPPIAVVLHDDSVIDISHESLIRQWQRLKDWTADEAESAKTYQRLEDRALEWQKQKADFLQAAELAVFQQWWQEKKPTVSWAKRYSSNIDLTGFKNLSGLESFALVEKFLTDSQAAYQQAERAKVRQRRLAFLVLGGFSILASGLAGVSYWQWQLAERHKQIAQKQKDLAMEVINQFTYDIPEALANIPQTGRLTADILEFNSQKLEEIYALNPDDKQAQRERASNFVSVGDLYLNLLGDVNKTLEYYQQGQKILEQIATQDPQNSLAQRDLSVSFEKLANVYLQLNDTAKALDYYQQDLKISEKIATQDPQNSEAQRDLSISFNKLADVYLQLNDTAQALDYYSQALKIREKIATQDPQNSLAQRDLSVSFEKLADVYLQLNDTAKALDYYNHALKIREKIATQDPQNSLAQRDLSVSFEKLANVYLQLNDTAQALDYYSQALKIREKIATQDPQNSLAQRDLSISFNKLADVYLQLNDTAQALDYYSQALKISEKIATQDPQNSRAQRDLFISYLKLGNLEKQRKNKAAAKAWFAKALPIAQKLALDKMNAKAQDDLEWLLNTMKELEKTK